MTDRARRLAIPLAAFLLGLVALGVAAVLTLTPSGPTQTAAAVGGPFRLIGPAGPVTEADFKGKPFLVFFGFTHCPDVCPTKLFELSQALAATGNRGQDLRALFISVDPERDTPDMLKNYLSSFDDRIIGLTGTPEEIAAVVKAYRAYARKVPTQGGDYTMEHTAIVYIMDSKGEFVGALDTTRPPEEVAAQMLKAS